MICHDCHVFDMARIRLLTHVLDGLSGGCGRPQQPTATGDTSLVPPIFWHVDTGDENGPRT